MMTSSPFFFSSVRHTSIPVTEYSIWGTGTIGTVIQEVIILGLAGVSLGTKFRASSNGSIIGVRWQKPPGAQGVSHIALFQDTTNLSGTVAAIGETSSGWQRRNFPSPVAITASTIYTAVARYVITETLTNCYYATNGYFTSSGITNGPLEAVATSVSINGVYNYGNTLAAPTETYQGSSYFVDVVYMQ